MCKKLTMDFEDAWLEVRACTGGEAVPINDKELKVSVISEVLQTASNVSGQSGLWDYSRRLQVGEMEAIRGVLALTKMAEDALSVSLSVNVIYKGSPYTLTLFATKRSQ
jgi:hypothetical protein